MGPKPSETRSDHDLFRTELVKLAELIDWQAFADEWSPQFVATTGRPALPTRLMAALLYLKHVYALSDEDVVQRWCENPYWQHFSGERYFRHDLPCDPSSLVRWRQRIGEAGCEWLLTHTSAAAKSAGVIKRKSLDAVVLDTTVQPKAIAHPTDRRLLNRAREQLVAAAQDAGIDLRQSYARVGKAAEQQAGRYAHAQQWRRMKREIRRLRTWLGRVIRDVQRKSEKVSGGIAGELQHKLQIAQRLYEQRRDSKHKLYALHAPEVECLAKGKARTPYEFGVKVSVAVTAKEGLVVGMRSMPGNPYDGHVLAAQLEQTTTLLQDIGVKPTTAVVDLCLRGVDADVAPVQVIHRGKRKTLTKVQRRWLKRRQAIEPAIGHTKHDNGMDRCWLKGSEGDALHAVLCAAGFNIRWLLRAIARLGLAAVVLCLRWLAALAAMPVVRTGPPSDASAANSLVDGQCRFAAS